MKKALLSLLLFTLLAIILTSCGGGHTHDWGEWTVIDDATCTKNGMKERACACGEVETSVIEATGHTFGEWLTLTPASCTIKGIEKRECSSCAKTESRNTAILDHEYDVDKITWAWNGYTDVYAELLCKNGCNSCKKITATIIVESYAEKIVYTASITYNGVVYTDVKEEKVIVSANDGFKYELVDDSYIRITEYIGDKAQVVIPSYATFAGIDYPVAEIGNSAFYGKSFVTDVEIPDTVTIIGEKAFGNCYSLANVNIPDSVKSIEYMAFAHCRRLTGIVIGDGVVTIGPSAFSFCNSLSSVALGKKISTIDANAFLDCVSLSSIEIPNSVGTIGYSAFGGCKKLVSIVIGDGVSRIDQKAFYNCIVLSEITIGNNVDVIEEYAFLGCNNLANVYINDVTNWCNIKFTAIDSNPLYYAGTLYINGELVTELVIPDDVISISNYAFSGCTSLESVVIPDSVTSIGDSAFEDCTGITHVVIGNSVAYISSDAFAYCTSLESVALPDSVTTIAESVFQFCSSLTRVVIPDSVTAISDYAFAYCTSLKSVVIPDSVISIGKSAFEGCCELASVVIPGSVTSIGDYAFQHCHKLSSVEIGKNTPYTVSSIGNMAFYNCNITDLYIRDLAGWCSIDFGILGNPAYYADNIYVDGELITTDLTIPDNVAYIGAYAFHGFDIVNLVVSDSVTLIGENAFYECNSLASLNIGKGIATIRDYAFDKCYNITSVEIKGKISEVGLGVFSSCSKIENVVAPAEFYQHIPLSSIKDITITSGMVINGLFKGCNTLTNVILSDGTIFIGDNAFCSCLSLANVVIGDNVITIGDCAFYDCPNLASLEIGDSVVTIGNRAFEDCCNLTNVVIPDSVTSIGNRAFSGVSIESLIIPSGIKDIYEGILYDIENCYYYGTRSQWKRALGVEQSEILEKEPYYYSEAHPKTDGVHWGYDKEGNIIIWAVNKTAYEADQYSQRYFDECINLLYSVEDQEWMKVIENANENIFTFWENNILLAFESTEFSISKKDRYKMLLLDALIYSENSVNTQVEYLKKAGEFYGNDIALKLFKVSSLEELKNVEDQLVDGELLLEYMATFSGFFGFGWAVDLAGNHVINLYRFALTCGQYMALYEMNFYYQDIFNDIACNEMLDEIDLKNAAKELAEYYDQSVEEVLNQIAYDSMVVEAESISAAAISIIDDLALKCVKKEVEGLVLEAAVDIAENVVKKIIDMGALVYKSVTLAVDLLFNISDVQLAYYDIQMLSDIEEVLVGALDVSVDDENYFYYDINSFEAGKYMCTVKLYENVVLMGYDASIAYLVEKQSGFIGTIFNGSEFEGYINNAEKLRSVRAGFFTEFREEITKEYNALYVSKN